MPSRKPNFVAYQAKDGSIALRADARGGTLWATQAQMAAVFGVTPQNVTIHLRRIYAEGELKERATCKESLQVRTEGARQVRRAVREYNLDALIAVGYRISSVVGTKFRQWATKVLRSYVEKGYAVDRKRVAANYGAFRKALGEIRSLLPRGGALDADAALELASAFAETWLSLDAYDRGELPVHGVTSAQASAAAEELGGALDRFAASLRRDGRAGENVGRERFRGALEGSVKNVFQSFGGKDLYPTVQEKAAHLLYFVVKDHPFADGNKRCGAYAFIWFLSRCGELDVSRLTPSALTALTLLVAASDPKDKGLMVGLTVRLLGASGE